MIIPGRSVVYRLPQYPWRLLVGALIWITLALALPILLIAALPTVTVSSGLAAVWIVVAVSAWYLSLRLLRRGVGWLQLTFWLYVYVFLGVAPLLQVACNVFPWPSRYTPDLVIFGATIVLLGCAGFALGAALRITRPSSIHFVQDVLRRRLSLRTTYAFAAFVVPASGIAIVAIGGFSQLFLAREELMALLSDVAGGDGQVRLQLLSTVLRVPTFAAAFLFAAFMLNRRTHGLTNGFALPVATVALVTCAFAINNPLASARYWFGSIVLGFALQLTRPTARNQFIAVAVLTAALLVVFPNADLFRRSLDVSVTDTVNSQTMIKKLVEKGDYDSFQQLLNAITYVEDKGLSFGSNLLGAAAFWAPRSIWPEKPISTGQVLAEHARYTHDNLSAPLWAEFFVAGGVIVVFMGFFFLGFIVHQLERAASRGGAVTLASVLVPFLAAYQFFFLRGALINAIAYVTPVLASFLICSLKTPRIQIYAVRQPH